MPVNREGSKIKQENKDIWKSFEMENDLMRGYLLKAAKGGLDQGVAQHAIGQERVPVKVFIRIGELLITASYKNNGTI